MTWRDALLDAWAVLLPVECAGCAAPDRGLCPECAAALAPAVTVQGTPGGIAVRAALRYEFVARRVILALKEQERTDVAVALAGPLAAAVAAVPGTAELATVPSSRAAWRRRGFDPVVLLARRAGLRPARVLRHRGNAARQKTLGLAERAENVRGSLAARCSLDGRRFVLLDDVLTTGATLDEASRAIQEAGGNVIGAATLAFTPRRLPVRDFPLAQDYVCPKGARFTAWHPGGSA